MKPEFRIVSEGGVVVGVEWWYSDERFSQMVYGDEASAAAYLRMTEPPSVPPPTAECCSRPVVVCGKPTGHDGECGEWVVSGDIEAAVTRRNRVEGERSTPMPPDEWERWVAGEGARDAAEAEERRMRGLAVLTQRRDGEGFKP